ncbi:M56 family metallopeptidase [Streptomyces griseofuscus]|uniref:M56 family metallopeptidase n=1 Tax=Streptomyces griseofuscus TaxID=146922 RepID=UPI00341AD253
MRRDGHRPRLARLARTAVLHRARADPRGRRAGPLVGGRAARRRPGLPRRRDPRRARPGRRDRLARRGRRTRDPAPALGPAGAAALPGDTELAVLDDPVPQAFALPGAPGRIVVSRGMLRCLGDDERAALLAHERAHLRGRHHLYLVLWRLTAAVTPLLRPLADAGGFVLERWADETAAAHVGSRTVVARAVGRAALATAAAQDRPAPAATGGAVPQRVRALLGPPPPPRALPVVAGAALLALCCASLAAAAFDSERMVVTARSAERATATAPADTAGSGHPSPVATAPLAADPEAAADGARHRHHHRGAHRPGGRA